MQAGAARVVMGRQEVEVGGSRVKLMVINTRILSGLKNELVSCFKLVTDHIQTVSWY